MKNRNLIILIALTLMAAALPALIGYFNSNSEQIYSGVVFNPIDGYTYLAKMQIGRSGDWLFSLPFTAQAGEGRLLFLFYIASGQLLNLIRVPLSVGFNLLRLIGYGLLIFLLNWLVEHVFPETSKVKTTAVLLMAVGGGLGWTLLPFGNFGADFWVAEAFPFLSGLANPHFLLALCLMVISIMISQPVTNELNYPGLFFTALLLSILSPFGFVVAACVLLLSWIWEKVDRQSSTAWPILVFVLAGIPYCAYQYWAVYSTPQLAAWTEQNQTPSPQVWDVLLTFSPWILLIIFSWEELLRLRKSPIIRKLIIWMIVGLALTIVPFNLQRRFMFGLSIPVTCLGLLILPYVAERIRFSTKKLTTICSAIVLPTPFLLLIMTSSAIAMHTPLYYFYTDELAAINWLSVQNKGRPLILASDQTGNMVPAVSRLRVLYGHPFETINAKEEKKAITDFFSGDMDTENGSLYLKTKQVDWIFYGPREREIGLPEIFNGKQPSRQIGNVSLYNTREIFP
jgi:hypothetical protein